MPRYTYECKKCKTETTLVKKIEDRDKPVCEKCNIKLNRKIETIPFVLKGCDWSRDLD